MANEFLQRFELLLALALLIPAIALGLLAALQREVKFWPYASAGMLFISFAAGLSAADNSTHSAEIILTSHLLLVFGYYLCSKSIRLIYSFRKWPWLEETGIIFFSSAFVLVVLNARIYEYLAATLSLCIMYFSVLWGFIAVGSWQRKKNFATATIITSSTIYAGVTALRALAALQINGLASSLPFWDQVFIMTSLAVTFLFAIAQFMHGNDLIQSENAQRLQQVTNSLSKERELISKLQDANKEQRNLQKLLLHEFKRPLTALHAALQVNESAKTAINADRMERLRALTKQANTYLEGIAQYQDIAELFEAPNWSLITVSEIAQDIATKWGVEVVTDDQLEDKVLKCDPLLVDIAISNLVENAQKFSKTPAGVSVRLACDRGKLQLEVQDDGPGIPKAEWQHIWEKFYKLDTETKSALTGCGLGLHIVDQVAKVHSGRASVVNTKPSIVRLELPLAAEENDNG